MGSVIIINGDDDFLKERSALEEVKMGLYDEVFYFKLHDSINKYTEFIEFNKPSSNSVIVLWGVSEVPEIVDCCTTIIVSSKKDISCKNTKRIVNVKKPKTYDDGIDYVRWILKEGERLNIDLKRIASALFVNCGTDLRKICSEIEKLRVLCNKNDTVDPNLAKRVICFSAELTPKNIVDAICEGNSVRAIAFYDKIQERGNETGWIIAFLQRHVLKQLRAKILKESGIQKDQIASALGLHPFFYEKTVESNMGLWGIVSLKDSLSRLCDLEIMHKRGVDVSCFGLETIIINLSEEANKNGSGRSIGN